MQNTSPDRDSLLARGPEALREFYDSIQQRRTHREFDHRDVDPQLIEFAVRAAGSAPSGANRQPWHFAWIQSPELRQQLRSAAEDVEREFYERKATHTWLEDLKPFHTNWQKPYLTDAPVVLAVFSRHATASQSETRSYYPLESTCLAIGFLLVALHRSGLVTLTHTPRPMNFLNQLLGFDSSFKPVMLIVAGYPSTTSSLPCIQRKELHEIFSIHSSRSM
jgi:iodotyrosine deiodinase